MNKETEEYKMLISGFVPLPLTYLPFKNNLISKQNDRKTMKNISFSSRFISNDRGTLIKRRF